MNMIKKKKINNDSLLTSEKNDIEKLSLQQRGETAN